MAITREDSAGYEGVLMTISFSILRWLVGEEE